jgi:hypothetical protein
MRPNCAPLSTYLVGVVAIAFLSTQLTAQRCGQERWSVKTGTDSGAASVDLSNPQNTTITQLVALNPPSPIPPSSRFGPTESTVFVVSATLTDYKLEGGSHGDSDYHLVLQDDAGNTMVAEIPSPDCVGAGSPFATQIANARAAFDSQLTATSSFQTANLPVQVTGVGFFDFPHGQRGAAPNVIELHPILNISFNSDTGGGGTDSGFIVMPATINVPQGGTFSSTVATSMKNDASDSSSLTVSGLPAGIKVHVTPAQDGKATLSFTSSTAAPTGTFPITVSGTAGGKVHSRTVQLSVTPNSSVPGTQQWEYQVITANNEKEVIDQANSLGAKDWEMVSVIKLQGTGSWRAFFKRIKNNY